jgi:hypothetical protein
VRWWRPFRPPSFTEYPARDGRVGSRRQKTPCRRVVEALYIVHGTSRCARSPPWNGSLSFLSEALRRLFEH